MQRSSALYLAQRRGKEGDCDDESREGTKTSKLDLLCGMKIFSEEFSTFALNVKESKKIRPEKVVKIASVKSNVDFWREISHIFI